MVDVMRLAYVIGIGLQAFVLGVLIKYGTWREYPAFAAINAFYALESIVLGTLVISHSRWHPICYWAFQIASWAFAAFLAGEITKRVWVTAIGLCLYASFLYFGLHLHLETFRVYTMGCGIILLLCASFAGGLRKVIGVALGINFLFSGISFEASMLRDALLRYIPVAASLVGTMWIIWNLKLLLRLEPSEPQPHG